MIESPRVNEMPMHSTPTPINSMQKIKEAIAVEGTGDMFQGLPPVYKPQNESTKRKSNYQKKCDEGDKY